MRVVTIGASLCTALCTASASAAWSTLPIDQLTAVPASGALLSHALAATLLTVAAAGSGWIALSNIGYEHALAGRRTLLARLARSFGTPSIRRAIAVTAVAFSVPGIAHADDAMDTGPIAEADSQAAPAALVDIGWGSIAHAAQLGGNLALLEATNDQLLREEATDEPLSEATNHEQPSEVAPDEPLSEAANHAPPHEVANDGSVSGAAETSPPPVTSTEFSAPSRAAGHSPRTVTVVPGDTLWDIASRDLPADASTHDIAIHTRRWFEANRAILTNPDLIHPGQILSAPKELP